MCPTSTGSQRSIEGDGNLERIEIMDTIFLGDMLTIRVSESPCSTQPLARLVEFVAAVE